MPTFGDYETVQELSRSAFGSLYSAKTATSAARFAVKVFRPQRDALLDEDLTEKNGDPARQIDQFLYAARLQQTVATEKSCHWAKVHLAGSVDSAAYYVTDLYARSAQKLAVGRIQWNPATLLALVRAVVEGLSELKKATGKAHGNLKPSNVLIGDGSLRKAPVALTDPAYSGSDASDMRAIGALIYLLVLSRPFRVNSGWPIETAPQWSRLGGRGERWRTLCSRLLDPLTVGGGATLDELSLELNRLRPNSAWRRAKLTAAVLAVPLAAGTAFVGVRYSQYQRDWEQLRSADARWLADLDLDEVRSAATANDPLSPLTAFTAANRVNSLLQMPGVRLQNANPPLEFAAYQRIRGAAQVVRQERESRQHWDKLPDLTAWAQRWKARKWPGADTFADELQTMQNDAKPVSLQNPYQAMLALSAVYPQLKAIETEWDVLQARAQRYRRAVGARDDLLPHAVHASAQDPDVDLPGALSKIDTAFQNSLHLSPPETYFDNLTALSTALQTYNKDPAWPAIDLFMDTAWVNVKADSLSAPMSSPLDWLKAVIPNWTTFNQVQSAPQRFSELNWPSLNLYTARLCTATLNAPTPALLQELSISAHALNQLEDALQTFKRTTSSFKVDPLLSSYTKEVCLTPQTQAVAKPDDLIKAADRLRAENNNPAISETLNFLASSTADDRANLVQSDWYRATPTLARSADLENWMDQTVASSPALTTAQTAIKEYRSRHWDALADGMQSALANHRSLDRLNIVKELVAPIRQLADQTQKLQRDLSTISPYLTHDDALASLITYASRITPPKLPDAREAVASFAADMGRLNIEVSDLADFLKRHPALLKVDRTLQKPQVTATPTSPDDFTQALQAWKDSVSQGEHSDPSVSRKALAAARARYHSLPPGVDPTIEDEFRKADRIVATLDTGHLSRLEGFARADELQASVSRIEKAIENAQLTIRDRSEQRQQKLEQLNAELKKAYAFTPSEVQGAWNAWVDRRLAAASAEESPESIRSEAEAKATNLRRITSVLNVAGNLTSGLNDPAIDAIFSSVSAEHYINLVNSSVAYELSSNTAVTDSDQRVGAIQQRNQQWITDLQSFGKHLKEVSDALAGAYQLSDEQLDRPLRLCMRAGFWPDVSRRLDASVAPKSSSNIPRRVDRLKQLSTLALDTPLVIRYSTDKAQSIEFIVGLWRRANTTPAIELTDDARDRLDRCLAALLNGLADSTRRTELQRNCASLLVQATQWSTDEPVLAAQLARLNDRLVALGAIDLVHVIDNPQVRYDLALVRLNRAADRGITPDDVAAFEAQIVNERVDDDVRSLLKSASNPDAVRDTASTAAEGDILKGWTRLGPDPLHPSRKTFTKKYPRRSSVEHALTFERVADGSYVCTSDFAVGLFIDLVRTLPADQRKQIQDRMDRLQVQTWSWGRDASEPGIAPNWTYLQPGWGGDDDLYPGGAPAQPKAMHPLQAVPPDVARYLAAALGCRLPSYDEWRSALTLEVAAEQQPGAAAVKMNLRDESIKTEWSFLNSKPDSVQLKYPAALGLDVSFDRRSEGNIVWKMTNGQDYDDGVLWFDAVDSANAGILFKHLLGNVKQFVWDPDGPSPATAMPPLSQFTSGVGGTLGVAGYSALSYPTPGLAAGAGSSLPPVKFTIPKSDVPVQPGCTDVGFRLAFSSTRTFAALIAEPLKRVHYQFITESNIPH